LILNLPNAVPQTLPLDVRSSRVTERQQFRRCRRMWHYAHVEKLLPVQQESDARTVGTVGHASLAAYYTHVNESRADRIALAKEEYHQRADLLNEDQQALLSQLLPRYFDWASIEDIGWKVLAVEQPFCARPEGSDHYVRGTVDLLIEIPGQGVYIIDHKFYRSFLTQQQIEFDDQLTSYIWMVRQNKINVRGAVYNMIRKKIPSKPRILKDGTLSKNVNIDTDRATYTAALREYGFDPQDYSDILAKLPDNDYFRREHVIPSPRKMQSFERRLAAELNEMFDPRTVVLPHFCRECAYCSYTSLCQCEEDQGDVEYLKSTLYTVVDEETIAKEIDTNN
jgi:hypothetical protein